MRDNIFLKALQKCLATCSFNVNFEHDKCKNTEKANTAKISFNVLSSRFTSISLWNDMARDFLGHATVKVKVVCKLIMKSGVLLSFF